MADESSTIWSVILIVVAGVCWLLYQVYKHLFLPWRNRHAQANLNAGMDRRGVSLENRRLSEYISNQTSFGALSQFNTEFSSSTSVAEGQDRSCTEAEGYDQPPTYSYVTHNQSEFFHDPPTYEEAKRLK